MNSPIKVQKLSKEKFSRYGEFYDYKNKEYKDVIVFDDAVMRLAFDKNEATDISVLHIDPRESVASHFEKHLTSEEYFCGFDGDVVAYFCDSKSPEDGEIEAFYVPEGTMFKVNINVWHSCPIPEKSCTGIVINAKGTFNNDLHTMELSKPIIISK